MIFLPWIDNPQLLELHKFYEFFIISQKPILLITWILQNKMEKYAQTSIVNFYRKNRELVRTLIPHIHQHAITKFDL